MAKRIETRLDGLALIEPDVYGDERGFLVETYRRDGWRDLGVDLDFVQHNHSRSAQGTLRGLHFLRPDMLAVDVHPALVERPSGVAPPGQRRGQ